MRLGGDVLDRRRMQKHRAGAPHDIASARQLRQIHFAKNRIGVRLSQTRRQRGDPAHAEDGDDSGCYPVRVEGGGDFRSGATNDFCAQPVCIFYDFLRRGFQPPDQPRVGKKLEDVEGRVVFPPAKALANAALKAWWLLCQPSPMVKKASSQLLRELSPVM